MSYLSRFGLGLVLFAISNTVVLAQIQQSPFLCEPGAISPIYHTLNDPGIFEEINLETGEIQVSPQFPIPVNATGLREADGFVYGLEDNIPTQLVRIGSDGSLVELGSVTGLPDAGVQEPNAGGFGPDGYFNVRFAGSDGTIYRVDVMTRTVVDTYAPALSGGLAADLVGFGDLVFSNADNVFYTIVNAPQLVGPSLVSFPVLGSTITELGLTGETNAAAGMFVDSQNTLVGIRNTDGAIFQYDTTTGTATRLLPSATVPDPGTADGFSCSNGFFFQPELPESVPVPVLSYGSLVLLVILIGLFAFIFPLGRRRASS